MACAAYQLKAPSHYGKAMTVCTVDVSLFLLSLSMFIEGISPLCMREL